jgi:beta-glucoside operon transcriptional antiterminator
MKIVKIINNNIVSSVDERGKEVVVMGKGIGFQKKAGGIIEESSVEKIFSMPSESAGQFAELVADIPYEHTRLAEEIIEHAKETLGVRLNKNIYITLTDHLSYAIERCGQGIEVQNALLWEIQKFYPKEYEVGIDALTMVQQKVGVQLPVDEAGFIALHLLNAEMDADLTQSAPLPGMIKDILNIIRYTMGKELDEKSLSYERLVTHLKFFLQRLIKHETYLDGDEGMRRAIREYCPEEYGCAIKIREYIKTTTGYETSEEEIMYLTMHINRVSRTENRE